MIRNRTNLREGQCTCRIKLSIQKSYLFPPLFLLFSSTWPFTSFSTPPNGSVIFLFFPAVSSLQHSSQRQVLLAHYLIIGAMEDHLFSLWHSERPGTFMEAQLCWFTDTVAFSSTFSRMQGSRPPNWFRRWTAYGDETAANWRAEREFELQESVTRHADHESCCCQHPRRHKTILFCWWVYLSIMNVWGTHLPDVSRLVIRHFYYTFFKSE